ncbi:MAG: response regulator [Lachnospiraceae bacterium]|nr:response regulator [Lachnospiraceae bacterium]
MYKVIVIEDETTVRRGIVLTTNWAALNCMVAGEAANGEEGIDLISRLAPDIVVTDVKMPRMDGVEMITKLRQAGCRSSFIILTAHSDFKYAQSALRLGVSDYLLKPLKDGDLEQAILTLLQKKGEIPAAARQSHTDGEPAIFRFQPDAPAKNPYVEAAIQFIRNHYREDITISTVARDLEISEGYLSRMFKKETDYTFTNYLIYYRLRLAMTLLKDPRVKVYEAADQTGYSDTAYFSAQFKKIVGLSPSEYQNRYGRIPV